MRKPCSASALAFIIAVIAASGCESTQPDRLETRSASLAVTTRALLDLFHCYEIWVDEDGDQIPDSIAGRQCDPGGGPDNRSLPWRYSLAVSVIHEGSTTEEPVTSLAGHPGSSVVPEDGIDDFVSMTDYDLVVAPGPSKPPQSGFYYLNPQTVSQGSPVYLQGILQIDLGVPNVLQESPEFNFEVDSGDTVIVRGRKLARADAPWFVVSGQDPEMELNVSMSINGVAVSPNPPGGATSSFLDMAGVSFSFTVR